MPADEVLLLGRDERGIGAVARAHRVDELEWKLLAGAVHVRLRKNADRYFYGDEVMRIMLDVITQRSVEEKVSEVQAWAYIHEGNTASAEMAERFDFTYMESEGELQRWARLLQCYEPEDEGDEATE